MGRGVFGCLPLVVTTCYYFAVKNDDGSDWDITYLGRCSSFVKCKTHPGVQIVLSYGCSHMVTIRGPVEREGTCPRAWRPGDLRHSRDSAESCCLPALTRFTGSGRTGPDRHTPERVRCNDTLGARISAPAGFRRDARADDSARLERVCGFTVTVGSNPTPSANRPRRPVSARL